MRTWILSYLACFFFSLTDHLNCWIGIGSFSPIWPWKTNQDHRSQGAPKVRLKFFTATTTSSTLMVAGHVTIGILALQGAFAEHQVALQKLSVGIKVVVVQVRTTADLDICDALVIPGGESTTIALLARLSGLLDPLREFLTRKPVWGTCAGAILLAQSIESAKKGGQELLGGMSITIQRNGWGSQVESFEAPLDVDGLRDPHRPFTGVFIRAPVLLTLNATPEDPPISVIARLPSSVLPRLVTTPPDRRDADPQDTRTLVAIRQGRHFLTTFHPELTEDNRFHEYFVKECVLPGMGLP